MPDSMPGSFFFDSPAPPKLDLVGASSQLFQVPQTSSASSSLYRSMSSRKRLRCEPEKFSLSGSQSALANSILSDAETPLVEASYLAESSYWPSRHNQAHRLLAIGDSIEPLVPGKETETSRKRARLESQFSLSPGSCVTPPQGKSEISWGRTMISMVSKVWDFCWSGTFGGFYAGEGQGYSMNPGISQFRDVPQSTYIEKDDVYVAASNRRNQAPIPGQIPESDIKRNWVVVPEEDRDIFVDAVSVPSPTRRQNRKNANVLYSQRKRAMMSYLERSTHPQPSPAKVRPISPRTAQSPSSNETRRHVAQIRRREREEDASIRRLNQQLEMMIEEGRAALGTKVDVCDVEMED